MVLGYHKILDESGWGWTSVASNRAHQKQGLEKKSRSVVSVRSEASRLGVAMEDEGGECLTMDECTAVAQAQQGGGEDEFVEVHKTQVPTNIRLGTEHELVYNYTAIHS